MPNKPKRNRLCKLPTPGNIAGRSSTITNAFYNAIIPIHKPSDDEERDALAILEMNPEDIRCVYCGDKATEWDHFRAIIDSKKPTGYITEIANLVPACGKCNQSKGGSKWKEWMFGKALQSPESRGVPNLDRKAAILEKYADWKTPVKIDDIENVVGQQLWQKHKENLEKVLALLKESQDLAKQIAKLIDAATERNSPHG